MCSAARWFQKSGGTYQDWTIATQQKIGDALLARLENTRAGYTRLDSSSFNPAKRWQEPI